MKTFITVIAAAVTLAPGVATAQDHDHAGRARTAAGVVQQTQVERREQERIRQSQERSRHEQARARARAQTRTGQYRDEQRETISRTLKIGGSGEIDLSNLSGDIVVTRGGGGSVRVEAVKVARGRTPDEAREMLTRVTVDVVERGSRAEVTAVYPRHDARDRNRPLNVSVQFTVTAPEHTRIAARSLSGDITVTDVKGDVNVSSLSGDVTIVNGARVRSAKSTSGKVEIANLRSEIALTANTLSGDLVVRQSRVPRMDLGTISGNLTITDVACGRVDVQTLSGDVAFNAPLEKNGRYELKSHSGVIRVIPTGNTGFELDASSFSGNIQSELRLEAQHQGVGDSGRRGQGGRTRSLRGVYGDGSAVLDITTFSGSVAIVKR